MTALRTQNAASTMPALFTVAAPRLFSSQALEVPPRDLAWLVQAAEQVKLLGRGGAAFPVASKLKAVRPGARVLANGSEGEPASWKDRALMRCYPDLVVAGTALVARALRSPEVIIAVGDSESAHALRAAATRSDTGVVVQQVDHGLVGGEIGALVSGLNGRLPVPGGQKVLPHVSGLRNRSTYASNVETFAHLALLSALGPSGYAAVGTRAEPGTSLLTLHGLDWHGVFEIPNGITLSHLLGQHNGPVLIGGYHGTWSVRNDLVLDRTWLRQQGIGWGAGVVGVLPDETCPIGEVARVAAWLASESVGQCGPCVFGLPAIAKDIASLAANERVDAERLRLRLGQVTGRGACHHPTGAAGFVASGLHAFDSDVQRHLTGRGCGRPVLGVLPLGGERR